MGFSLRETAPPLGGANPALSDTPMLYHGCMAEEAPPSRGGRPRLADEARRTVRVLARLTPAEGERLRRLAAQRGTSLSETLVEGMYRLRGETAPAQQAAERAELLAELAPIGRNLNQLARSLNTVVKGRGFVGGEVFKAISLLRGLARALAPVLAGISRRR